MLVAKLFCGFVVGFVFFNCLLHFCKDYLFSPMTSDNVIFVRVIDKRIIADECKEKSAYMVFLDFPGEFGKAVKVKKKKYNKINVGDYVRVRIKEIYYDDEYYEKCKIKKIKKR